MPRYFERLTEDSVCANNTRMEGTLRHQWMGERVFGDANTSYVFTPKTVIGNRTLYSVGKFGKDKTKAENIGTVVANPYDDGYSGLTFKVEAAQRNYGNVTTAIPSRPASCEMKPKKTFL